MKVTILGIDGLEKTIVDKYIDQLSNFKKISEKGILSKIDSVFPADSVPAWNTIFTGLTPSEHGIIRGKDYIESYDDYKRTLTFKLEGNTFWDKLSNQNYKCLILNPFLAYPAWKINGIMESGPSFVEGTTSCQPQNTTTIHPESLGGYKAVGGMSSLKRDMQKAYSDTADLWKEYKFQSRKDNFDLEFITFTTLDRIQHYVWRFYDENDPLHEYDEYLSNLIFNTLKLFDSFIGELLKTMNDSDKLLIISDHGFGQRPYKLLNMNEILRKQKLLIIKNEESSSVQSVQKLKSQTLRQLSKLKILDPAIKIVRLFPFMNKLKKSNHLIDKEKSICYVDEYFNGKKPYCGLNFGMEIRNSGKQTQKKAYQKIFEFFNSGVVPKPKWIGLSSELFEGEYHYHYPDICFELPKEYGIEYDLFGENQNISVTHYKLSGGHLGPGTYGVYSQNNESLEGINSIVDFSSHILGFWENINSKTL